MNISILIHHSEIWEFNVLYSGYKSDGIVVGENISFVNLRYAIAVVLDINEQTKKLEIRYVVEGNASSICIHNIGLNFKVKRSDRERYEVIPTIEVV